MTSSVAALAAIPASAAYAQDATATTEAGQPAPVDPGNIIITGYRSSIRKSLDQKRNANAVVEVITAEDISKFPDKNVADSLQRVPGVVITRDGGEGKSVSVRGLAPDLTLTELNGNYIASAETNNTASRSFNYVLMPSNMLASAELYKSSEARLDEGGIGGTVILRTRRPLDLPSLSGFVSAEGTYADTTRKVDPQLSGMISWHNRADNIGFLVGATYQRRTTRTMSVNTEDWRWYSDRDASGNDITPFADVNGNVPANGGLIDFWGGSGFNDQNHPNTDTAHSQYSGFALPTAVGASIREEDRRRLGIQATAQFRPTDNLTLTANYFRFDLQGNYTQNTNKIPEWSLARINWDGNWQTGRTLNGLTFDPSGTIVTGAEYEVQPGKFYPCNEDEAAAAGLPPGGWGGDSCVLPTPQTRVDFSREKALSQTIDVGADWQHDLWKVAVKGGRTWAKGGPSLNFYVSTKPYTWDAVANRPIAQNTFSAWDISGTPTFTFSDNLQSNLTTNGGTVDLGSTFSSWKQNTVSQNYGQADVTRSFDNSFLRSIQFGVKYRDQKAHANTGNTYWYCPGTTTRYQDSQRCAGADEGVALPSMFGSSENNIPGGFNANVFPTIDIGSYMDHLTELYGPPVRHPEANFVYNANEKILAGYLQANYKIGRLRGNLGVRVVQTKQHGDTTDKIRQFLDYSIGPCPSSGTYAAGTSSAGFAYDAGTCQPGTAITPWGGQGYFTETYEVVGEDRKFTDFLPSFNFAYDLTPDLLLRGAAAKVIARPSYAQPDQQSNLDFISQEFYNDKNGQGVGAVGWTGGGVNRALEPFAAWQFDLGLEYYFHPGSVLGVGLFRKNISNFVIDAVFDKQMVVNGETVTVNGFSTQANGQKAVSQGVEIYAQHTLPIGLGFQANFTYNDTNLASVVIDGQKIGSSPLTGSAKTQFNGTVFYENEKLLLRASFNRRGTVVGGLHNGLSIYADPYNQLDLNAAYNINRDISLTASVLNLTKSEQRYHLGKDTKDRFYANNYAGRIIYFGATAKFGGAAPVAPPPPVAVAPPPLPPTTQTCADGTVIEAAATCPMPSPPPPPPPPVSSGERGF